MSPQIEVLNHKQITEKTIKDLKEGKKIAILGVRRVGKTYTLKQIKQHLQEATYIPNAEALQQAKTQGGKILLVDNAYKLALDHPQELQQTLQKARAYAIAMTPYQHWWLTSKENIHVEADTIYLINLDYKEHREYLREVLGQDPRGLRKIIKNSQIEYILPHIGKKLKTIIIEETITNRQTVLQEKTSIKNFFEKSLPQIETLLNGATTLAASLYQNNHWIATVAKGILTATIPSLQITNAIIALATIIDYTRQQSYDKNPLIQLIQTHPAVLEEIEREKGLKPGTLNALKEALTGTSIQKILEKLEKEEKFYDKLLDLEEKHEDKLDQLLELAKNIYRELEKLQLDDYVETTDPEETLEKIREKLELEMGERFYNLDTPGYRKIMLEIIRKAQEGPVIIAAPTGTGKTRLLYTIAQQLANNGHPIYYLSGNPSIKHSKHLEKDAYIFYDDINYGKANILVALAKHQSNSKRIIVTIRSYVYQHLINALTTETPTQIRRLSQDEANWLDKHVYVLEYDDETMTRFLDLALQDLSNRLGIEVTIEDGARKKIVEKAKTKHNFLGRDRETPTLYYLYQLTKYIEKEARRGKTTYTIEDAERMPYGLINLNAALLLEIVCRTIKKENDQKIEKKFVCQDVEKAATVILPLVLLAIHEGSLPTTIFKAFIEQLQEITGKTHEKNYYYESETHTYLPHDSWTILLDTKATNTEILQAQEDLGPENYIGKFDKLLHKIYENLSGKAQLDKEAEQQCLEEPKTLLGKHYSKERCLATLLAQTILAQTLDTNKEEYIKRIEQLNSWNYTSPFPDLAEITQTYHTDYQPLIKPICRKIDNQQLYCAVQLYLQDNTEEALKQLIKLAQKGNETAVWALRAIALANREAFKAIKPETVEALAQAAQKGSKTAAWALGAIAEANREAFKAIKPETVEALAKAAQKGNDAAAQALETIAGANREAFKAIKPETVEALAKAAQKGNKRAAQALWSILVVRSDLEKYVG